MRKHFFLLLTMMVLIAIVPYNIVASELNTNNIDISSANDTYTEKQKSAPKNLTGEKEGRAEKPKEEKFKSKYGEKWRVNWNKHTGAPKTIFGYHYDTGMGEVADESKATTIADSFISNNEELFKISMPDLKNQKVKKGNIGWVVTYEQYYNEVPVKYGRVLVAVKNTGYALVLAPSEIFQKTLIKPPFNRSVSYQNILAI